LTLCAVGELSRQSLTISRRAILLAPYSPFGINKDDLDDILQNDDATDMTSPKNATIGESVSNGFILDPKNSDPDFGSLSQAEQAQFTELLATWEEPTNTEEYSFDDDSSASIRNVLEFRNALAKLDKPYMLGIAWGDVSTRQKMVLNSQSVSSDFLLIVSGSIPSN
jgi:hypothetical protein